MTGAQVTRNKLALIGHSCWQLGRRQHQWLDLGGYALTGRGTRAGHGHAGVCLFLLALRT